LLSVLADGRALIDRLRKTASEYKLENGVQIPVSYLARKGADDNQSFTQQAFRRPYGVEIILAHIDEVTGPSIFKIDPAGHFCGYKAVASGVKEQEATNQLEKLFKQNKEDNKTIGGTDTITTAIDILQNVVGNDFKATDIEVGIASVDNTAFRTLTEAEIEVHLNTIAD